ncbi:MAG TPA: substrate-binding domain-containing protein [Spirillospora sp.]|nr:substrate-binding domain-containing protein [Spirillospora sp.]
MGRARRTLVIVGLTLASCSSPVLPASTPTSDAVILRLNSSPAMLPLLTELTQSYTQVMPGVHFEISTASHATLISQAVGNDGIYFLTNHLPPEDDELWGAPIGQDGIVIITHPDNPPVDLTTEQLRGIYQGQITDWSSLTGVNLAIVVISREAGSSTRAEFERLVMGERQTTQIARIAPSSSAMLASAARQPGATGYVSLGYLDSSVQAIHIDGVAPTQANIFHNAYPLRTTIFFAGPGEPEGALRAFIGWVQSPEGQAVVARRYVPLTQP